MNDSSDNDWPQAIGSEGTVLLHRGRQMEGNFILPTSTEVWQWNEAKEQFDLKVTVPYKHRYSEPAKLLQRSR